MLGIVSGVQTLTLSGSLNQSRKQTELRSATET